jgi:hypothetical protein
MGVQACIRQDIRPERVFCGAGENSFVRFVLYQALPGFHAAGHWPHLDFITSESLHNERHGGCLLCSARTAGDGYRVGSGWRAPCRPACRAAYIPSAPRLPQYAAGENQPKGIAQSQSTSWGS